MAVALLLMISPTLHSQEETKSLADLPRESLQGIQNFGLIGDYVDVPEPLKSAMPLLAKDVIDRLTANSILKTATANWETNKTGFPALWITLRSKCMDTSAAVFEAPSFHLPLPEPPPPPGIKYIFYTANQLAYIGAYKAYSLARATAAGQTLIPPVCSVIVGASFEQYVLSSTKLLLPFPAQTWTRQETLLETQSQVVSKTRETLATFLDAFIADYTKANPYSPLPKSAQ